MLSNAYLLAKFRFDTAKNERNFAENFAKNSQLPYGRRGALARALAVAVQEPPRERLGWR